MSEKSLPAELPRQHRKEERRKRRRSTESPPKSDNAAKQLKKEPESEAIIIKEEDSDAEDRLYGGNSSSLEAFPVSGVAITDAFHSTATPDVPTASSHTQDSNTSQTGDPLRGAEIGNDSYDMFPTSATGDGGGDDSTDNSTPGCSSWPSQFAQSQVSL